VNKAITELAPEQAFALTLLGEAENQGADGQVAVGTVCMNRVENRSWDGDDIKEVCYFPAQFSCFNEREPVYPKLLRIASNWDHEIRNNPHLAQCLSIATGLLSGMAPRDKDLAESRCCQYVTKGWRRYMDQEAEALTGEDRKKIDKKRWWARMKLVKTLKNHEFYA
jgi:hypothetical protein